MTTLERMARAICDVRGLYPTEWREFVPDARAALMAIREPSEGMFDEGGYMLACERTSPQPVDTLAGKVWTAMIDQILAEGGG